RTSAALAALICFVSCISTEFTTPAALFGADWPLPVYYIQIFAVADVSTSHHSRLSMVVPIRAQCVPDQLSLRCSSFLKDDILFAGCCWFRKAHIPSDY